MNQQNHLLCSHCGSQAIEGISSSDSKYTFCCNGCKLIFFCIQDSGLHNFYDIMKSQGEKIVTASEEITEYEYLKEIDFHEKFSSGDSKNCYFFYIQGIECLACSWIFSNLTSINKDLKNSNFRSESNVLELTVDDHKSLYDIVKFVAKLGYKVVPIKNIEEANLHYQNEKKSDLIRIGITGSLWMNIMIFSVSLYSGASDYFTLYFKYIQALLFLPIMTFSSYPFYKNLITGLKNKKTSIDFPIVLSIILGSILSYLSLYKGGEKFYFDSISMFIFLILGSRYALSYLYRKEATSSPIKAIYGQQQALLIDNEKIKFIHLSQVKSGDKILVKSGCIVPISGDLLNISSHFNESLVTGESTPVIRNVGENIRSGAKNLTNDVIIKTNFKSNTNSFHDYLSALNFSTASLEKHASFGSAYSLVLLFLLLFISLLFLILNPINVAYEKILSLMIICCPCALGIGMPLATILKIKRLSKKGIAIRDKAIFEKFNDIEKLCFDKTGTLTSGRYKVKKTLGNLEYLSLIIALEKRSEHPTALFLCDKFKEYDKNYPVHDFIETPGEGVSGVIGDRYCTIHSNVNGVIHFSIDNEIVFKIYLEEEYITQNIHILQELSKKYQIEILTGDRKKNMHLFLQKCGEIPNLTSYHSLSPQQKKEHIKSNVNTIFIGDGLNDILAMKESLLSISMNASKLVNDMCSVVFWDGDLKKLQLLLEEISHLHLSVKKIIMISILYNIVGITLVVFQIAGPLTAAFLMPLSSFIVVIFTILSSRRYV